MQRLRFAALIALALSITHTAAAEDAPEPASPALSPPRLLQAAQPVYPPAQLESAASAVVALVLTLDDTGQVSDVSIVASAGDDFDQAAVAAAKQLRFAPATRDGKPVASKIPFRFQFEPQAPAPAATPTP